MGFFQKFKLRSKTQGQLATGEFNYSYVPTASKSADHLAVEEKCRTRRTDGEVSQQSRRLTKQKSWNHLSPKDSGSRLSRTLSKKKSFWSSRSRSRSTQGRQACSHSVSPPPVPSKSDICLLLPSRTSTDSSREQTVHRTASSDHLTVACSSGSSTPVLSSLSGEQSSRSTNPSPASTISAALSGYGDFHLNSEFTERIIETSLLPEPLNIRRGGPTLPVHIASDGTEHRLSSAEVEKMRASLYAGSVCSSLENPTAEQPSPTEVPKPPPTFELSIDHETSRRLSAVVNDAAATFMRYTMKLQRETPLPPPPPIPPKSAARQCTIGRALTTDSVSRATNAAKKALPSITPPPDPTTSRVDLVEAGPSGTQPTTFPPRRDSLTDAAAKGPPYTRPVKRWYATHERFMEVFDEIPTNAASARRENPKLYQIRKRRALVEMGLTEHDLVEPTTTPRGEEIMVLLDALDERLQRERRVEAERSRLEEAAAPATPRFQICEPTVGVHNANDVRSGFGCSARREWHGNVIGGGKGKEKARDWKGKGRAVE